MSALYDKTQVKNELAWVMTCNENAIKNISRALLGFGHALITGNLDFFCFCHIHAILWLIRD